MSDLFQTDPDEIPALDPNKVYKDELVGEGKKFKDEEALARAKVESDRYIAQLLREQEEMRQALNKRINEEEFLTKLETLSKGKSPDPQDPPVNDGTQTTAITPEAVEEIIARREAENQRKTNLATAIAKLQETFGDDYKRHVQAQAKALGVGTDFLTDAAAKNPQAFYRLIGLDQQTKSDAFSPPPRSSVQQSTSSNPNAKNYGHFKRLRSEKGDGWYFSQPVQQEIWRELKSQGEDNFYK